MPRIRVKTEMTCPAEWDIMMPGSKGHAFYVHMKKHDTEAQKHRKGASFHGKMCGFKVGGETSGV